MHEVNVFFIAGLLLLCIRMSACILSIKVACLFTGRLVNLNSSENGMSVAVLSLHQKLQKIADRARCTNLMSILSS